MTTFWNIPFFNSNRRGRNRKLAHFLAYLGGWSLVRKWKCGVPLLQWPLALALELQQSTRD